MGNKNKMTETFDILTALLILGAAEISLASELEKDVSASSVPPYWSVECGDRTFIGSYTVMMDWPDCSNYCKYFPHSGELGHTFTFADILDNDINKCLRDYMVSQYIPGTGYEGQYWVGGYKGEDGQFKWHSGEQFSFENFVDKPGDEEYISLKPSNNYHWDTQGDQNKRNSGCLCKSQETTSEKILRDSECQSGWTDLGPFCIRPTLQLMNWNDSRIRCQAQGADLVSFSDDSEYMPLHFWLMENCVNNDAMCHRWWTSGNDFMFPGDWMWGEGPEYVPFEYWNNGEPSGGGADHCAEMNNEATEGKLDDAPCEWADIGPLCQIRK